MKLCINSRDLTSGQRNRIQEYFQENFWFDGRRPTLVWKADESDYMLLGYPHGCFADPELSHDFHSIMFRVHESNLMKIAGRFYLELA